MYTDTEKMSTISTVGNWKKTNKKTQAIKYARMSVISLFLKYGYNYGQTK